MELQFQKHYTLEEARALLPQIRIWLANLQILRAFIDEERRRVEPLFAEGRDLGGSATHEWVGALADIKSIFQEFKKREIQIKDPHRGLIDFPAIREGREIFLCWELDEEDIEYWHDLDAGYSGREKL
jgi:hypothetical protein